MPLEDINELMEKAKSARINKEYLKEYNYLEQAIRIDPDNTGILNALIRNTKKRGAYLSWQKWLLMLVQVKPTGESIGELLRLSHLNPDVNINEKELLLKRLELEPGNKKVLRELDEIEKREMSITIEKTREFRSQPLVEVDDETYDIVKNARGCIYSEMSIAEKKAYLNYTFYCEKDILLVMLAELFKSLSLEEFGIKIVQAYKKEAIKNGDALKLRLANRLLEMIKSRKTMYGTWELFWLENRNRTREKDVKRLEKIDERK